MDSEGYLPISLIASFHRVQALTQDVGLVVQALLQSPDLQLKDGIKVRTSVDPEKWPILPEGNISAPSTASSAGSDSPSAPSPIQEEESHLETVTSAQPKGEFTCRVFLLTSYISKHPESFFFSYRSFIYSRSNSR